MSKSKELKSKKTYICWFSQNLVHLMENRTAALDVKVYEPGTVNGGHIHCVQENGQLKRKDI